MSNFLKVCEMAVKKSAADGQEVRVTGVLNVHDTPRILPGPHLLAVNLNEVLGANNGKRHQTTKLSILLHGVLVVLLDIVGEVVHGNAVVLNILHDKLLGFGQFGRGERVGLADDGDDVDTGRKALHQFDVQLTQSMAGGCDEVEQDVNAVVPEAGVTLDS